MSEEKKRVSYKERLKEEIKDFPKGSGVYLMKNETGKIIYVGKAKILRNRVRSYFSDSKNLSPKTRFLINQIRSIDYLLTNTEVEAFLLEASLIKKHRPKYNIALRDDKSFPYIRLTIGDDFPRFYVSRRVRKDGALYFGPYTSGYDVSRTIKILSQAFTIRDCTDAFMKARTRPCMTYQIGRCSAPCVGFIDKKEYEKDVQGALLFLRGKNSKLEKELSKRMKTAAGREQFETAAKLRDSLTSIQSILEKQIILNEENDRDRDAIGYFGDERGVMVASVHVRKGRHVGTRSHFIPLLDVHSENEDPRDWLVSFINQFYYENVVPDEVLLPVEIGGDLVKLLEGALLERRGEKVRVRFPTDQGGTQLLELADRMSRERFKNHIAKTEKKKKGLQMIQSKLGLKDLPYRIECYDISHFQGAETVASQVVFEEGTPAKDEYRRYKIKTIKGVDDYASMKEVLSRRLAHTEYDDPQLLVIDGGKGQLGIAVEVLRELDREDLPVVSLAKARTERGFQESTIKGSEERFYIPGRQNPITFAVGSPSYQILVGIRDEAHRFAVSYHRKLRESSSLESELDSVPGLGSKRKTQLLKNFGDLDAIRAASIEDIANLRGFNRIVAEKVVLHLNESFEKDEEKEK